MSRVLEEAKIITTIFPRRMEISGAETIDRQEEDSSTTMSEGIVTNSA